jgi:mRNA-degrading endonuclease RelE of RelBE toxin-antitoxin system
VRIFFTSSFHKDLKKLGENAVRAAVRQAISASRRRNSPGK